MKCSRCPEDSLPNSRYCRSCRRAYDRDRYARIRLEWLAALGGECAECGSVKALEIDHTDPATKAFDPSKRWTVAKATISGELAKCQLLCAECHEAKSNAEREVPHGGGTQGKKLCRCAPCLTQKSAYMKEYHSNKRTSLKGSSGS